MNDFIAAAQRSRLEQLRRRDPFVRDVLQQLNRILLSRRFSRVHQRAKDFLTFVVVKTLLGQADQIKELVIGLIVFEKPDFDPLQSSLVRVAAIDLRRRLDDYANHEGRNDPIEIAIQLNTYVPQFRDRRPTLCISEIENWHPRGEQPHLCETIAAELAYQLGKAGLRAIRDVDTAFTPRSAHYRLRGSVEPHKERLRVSLSLADCNDDTILCSPVVEGRREDILKLTRNAVDVLLHSLCKVAEASTIAADPVRRRG